MTTVYAAVHGVRPNRIIIVSPSGPIVRPTPVTILLLSDHRLSNCFWVRRTGGIARPNESIVRVVRKRVYGSRTSHKQQLWLYLPEEWLNTETHGRNKINCSCLAAVMRTLPGTRGRSVVTRRALENLIEWSRSKTRYINLLYKWNFKSNVTLRYMCVESVRGKWKHSIIAISQKVLNQ